MIISQYYLKSFSVLCGSSRLGTISGFVLDDSTWKIDFAIIQVGKKLQDHALLLSVDALGDIQLDDNFLSTLLDSSNYSNENVQSLIDLDTSGYIQKLKIVTSSPEKAWHVTRPMPIVAFPMPYIESFYVMPPNSSKTISQLHERQTCCWDIVGRNIQSIDKDIGPVDDFFINTKSWKIDFITFDTGRWLPGKKVVVPIEYFNTANKDSSHYKVDLLNDVIKNGPVISNQQMLNNEFVSDIRKYYLNNKVTI
jgi:hypothetical protein